MYCAIADVRKRNLLILTEDGVPDSSIVSAIEYAGSIVDGMLVFRHPVPFSPVPVLIREITADIAASRCIANAVGSAGTNEEPKQAKNLYEGAMNLLKETAGSRINPVSQSGEDSVGLRLKSTSYNNGRIFRGWDPAEGSKK